MSRRLAALLMLLAVTPSVVDATQVREAGRRNLRIEYDNGDRLSIDCGVEQCALSMRVERRSFRLDQADLGVSEIYPDHARLYFVDEEGRGKKFEFEVSAACADEIKPGLFECSVSALVRDGKIEGVSLERYSRPELFSFDPSAPPERLTWAYTLVATSKERLELLRPVLEAKGYRLEDEIDEWNDVRNRQPSSWVMRVFKEEDFTLPVLAQRKREFVDLAEKHGVELYSVILE